MKSSLSFACVSVFALAVSVVFGAPSAYDDMAALRPAGGADDFWDTSRHSAVVIDVESSSSVGRTIRRHIAVQPAWEAMSGIGTERVSV